MFAFLETLNTATKALLANKGRSVLTTLGVVIGVFSVVMMISLGQGVQNYITSEFDALGTNLLFVSPGKVSVASDPATSLTANPLDEKHMDLIQTYASEHISGLTPYQLVGAGAEYKVNSYYSEVVGLNSEGVGMLNYELEDGRNFTTAEVRTGEKVALIGQTIVNELFANQNPIDKRIKLDGESYSVIGVFAEKGSNYDDQIIAPHTAVEDTFGLANYASIVAKVDSQENSKIASRQVELALLRDLDSGDFTVLSQEDLLSTIQETLAALTLGLGLIAGISLVVGGIGIMNIMLVSVTERIREIGLRKALGATSRLIALQFLVESIVLSIIGGLVGLALGWIGTKIAQQFFQAEIPIYAVFVAFGFSAFVGMVFGTYPALNASKKDPIESLRYE